MISNSDSLKFTTLFMFTDFLAHHHSLKCQLNNHRWSASGQGHHIHIHTYILCIDTYKYPDYVFLLFAFVHFQRIVFPSTLELNKYLFCYSYFLVVLVIWIALFFSHTRLQLKLWMNGLRGDIQCAFKNNIVLQIARFWCLIFIFFIRI